MATKKGSKGKAARTNDGTSAKQLDEILDVLKILLIIEGHAAGITKAKVRAMAKAADASVSRVWRELESARKAREKAAKKAARSNRPANVYSGGGQRLR